MGIKRWIVWISDRLIGPFIRASRIKNNRRNLIVVGDTQQAVRHQLIDDQ